MSSTIHSFGPNPASGFSCELVAWVDTALDRLFQTRVARGYGCPGIQATRCLTLFRRRRRRSDHATCGPASHPDGCGRPGAATAVQDLAVVSCATLEEPPRPSGYAMSRRRVIKVPMVPRTSAQPTSTTTPTQR